MHLVFHGVASHHSSVYKNQAVLTRPDCLSHLFRKLRMNRNLTKRALSNKLMVVEDYISAVEAGSRFPSVGYCLSCAREFGVNPEWVKRHWVHEMVERFQTRLNKRLDIED